MNSAYNAYAHLLHAQNTHAGLLWTTVVVHEREHALLFRRGRYERALPAGLHRLFGRHLQVVRLERRRQLLELPAQELLTADGATLKATAQVTWQIADPLAAHTRDADLNATLYAAMQQALRAAVATRTFDQLNGDRPAIAAAMRDEVAAAVAAIGLEIHHAALKDVMPGSELRKALAAVTLARQEGLAALEKARSEHASLRLLANAARLLVEQPELARLKGLQVLADGMRAGATVVVNTGDGGIVPLRH